jgi:sugar O-acyltransferase (sialic acid O-acetyltransferase NeuD family)
MSDSSTLNFQDSSSSDAAIDPRWVVVYGGGGHAKAVIELIEAEGKYSVAGILDDSLPLGSTLLGKPVLGGGEALLHLKERGIGQVVNAVGGITDIHPRLAIYDRILAAGLTVPDVVHPRAWVEKSAQLHGGAQILCNTYVGSDNRIGFGCLMNVGVILSHDCVLGDFVNLSPGAILAGNVQVGPRTRIGMGVTINLGIHVGSDVRIGNSAVIKKDVPDGKIVHAGEIWPRPRIYSMSA